MGREVVPLPVRLIMGVLWSGDEHARLAREMVSDLFGSIDKESEAVPFEGYTSYYEGEMGGGIRRCYWSFADLIPPGALADIKLATNRIEVSLSSEGRRTINLDPGLVSLASLVLATTKPYYHRIYLGKGIYADLALVYRKGNFEPLLWTYPDYREKWAKDFFLDVRRALKRGRRSGNNKAR